MRDRPKHWLVTLLLLFEFGASIQGIAPELAAAWTTRGGWRVDAQAALVAANLFDGHRCASAIGHDNHDAFVSLAG